MRYLLCSGLLFCLQVCNCIKTSAQELSLEKCIEIANKNNNTIKIAEQSLETRIHFNEASKQNFLPKVDFLAGYNHLSNPIEINLQQVKPSILEGVANQSVSSVNQIYQQLSGNELPGNIQQLIYQSSKDIVNAVYPNFNPMVSKQDYLLAGVAVRQPIYFGGKLQSARALAEQQLQSGKINVETAHDLTAYNIALQYIQIMYFNSMIEKQTQSLNALKNNETYATSLLQADIIPSYQKNWADVAKTQGAANLAQLETEKENALLTLKQLMGVPLDENIEINKKLKEDISLPVFMNETENNADLRLLNSKKSEAQTGVDISNSMYKPNVFAIANVQFLRKNLPLITPPWIVGIEMQWTLFDTERKSKKLAAQSLVTETELLIKQKKEAVNLATKVAQNKLVSFKNQSETLNNARQQTYVTSDMIRKRLENGLSSVKDVNEALSLQYESEKLFYTSVAAYQAALATYFYIVGEPKKIENYLN